jgi:hypothetical protein
MLPDLRIVIAAVVSTFIFTVGVGFFASSRLIHEQMTARIDTKGFDDTPINRIALNWPEPTKSERNIDLDFAVSAKGSRNPVRDIAPDVEPQQAHRPTAAPTVAEPTAPAPPTEIGPRQEAAIREPEPKLAETPTPAPVPTLAITPSPAIETPVEPDFVESKPETKPLIAVAKAPDPVEDFAPAAPATPESATDTHVVVRPDETADAESTGSIPAQAPETPDIPIPQARPKFAARTEAADAEPAKPAISDPAQVPSAARKRPRPSAVRPRPAAGNTAPQVQQLQPFDFFGLFRTPPATFRLPPQVTIPATTPIN